MEMNCENDPALFNLSSNDTLEFLGRLERFHKFYGPIHGFICVAICVFGLLTNLIHVIVLTRPSMRNSAVNSIMTAVAFCDMGTMGSYLIYIYNFVFKKYPNTCSNNLTYLWMVFLFAHIFLSIVLHTTSLWLAVAMAFMRRMTLRVASLNSPWQKSNYAYRISFGVFLAVFVLTIPTWYVHEIIVTPYKWKVPGNCSRSEAQDQTVENYVYTINYNSIAKANGCGLFKANLWMTGIIFKVIPCFFLICLSSSLMARLHNAEKKHQLLLVNNGNESVKRIVSDRTTMMLLTILIVFLVTELPQGVLSIFIAIYTNDVYNYIYRYLGDVLDLLSLINSSVNFVLYCLMSSRYRHTFCAVILPRPVARCIKNRQQTSNNTNYYSNSDYNPVRIRKVSEFPLAKKSSCLPEYKNQTTRETYYRSITPNLSETRRVI